MTDINITGDESKSLAIATALLVMSMGALRFEPHEKSAEEFRDWQLFYIRNHVLGTELAVKIDLISETMKEEYDARNRS